MVHGILAHQSQGRRLRQSVGTEIRTRIDRLLGDVEQQRTASALPAQDLHRCLGDILVRKKIEFETFPQCCVVDVADPALPGRTGIRNHDVHPTVGGNDGIEGRRNRTPVGDVAPDAKRVEGRGGKLRARRVEIKKNHLGAACAKGRRRGKPDRPGTAGNDDDLPLQRLWLPACELCLLERPIFDLELVTLGNALEAPALFHVRNHRNRGLPNVGGDTRVFCGCPDTE